MNLENFCNKIGYKFNEIKLLEEALTHPSFAKKSKINYQRLEFLGDKVLSLIISEFLTKKYKKENEGDLSKRHASLVSGESLSKIALEIGINEVLKMSNGEEVMNGRINKRNLENALEA
ncbi:MAG TPA: ribonuclease III domain-containing protein, partial [Rickettsiales bacterium]|nr:ribonuclease III domain-containing protein [Rickettsiales bacterium]